MTVAGKLLKPFFEVTQADVAPLPDVDNATTQRLQQVVFTVTECCHKTLFNPRFDSLVPKLDAYDEELRGFAYEGAGVGLAALDYTLRWKLRTKDFIAGPGARYMYAIYLGAGMGLARIRRNPESFRVRLEDPVFSWVVLDGYGFHEGFFRHRRYVAARAVPMFLDADSRRVFDNGLGRSIWFTTGANVERVAETIGGFPEERRAELWGGVGLACGYTGGVDRPTIEMLPDAAGKYRPELALGVAIAAKARQQVGNLAGHNELACEVLCGLSSKEAADVADTALRELPAYGTRPAYARWRRRIREQFA